MEVKDFLNKMLNIGDSVIFISNNEFYKGTVSHFTKYKVAVMFGDYDGAIKCAYKDHNKLIKI